MPESIENTEKEEIFVGDVIPKKIIEKSLEPDASPGKKLMWYAICTVVGLGIGFLLVYFYF
ncbi:MAG: hypothetical protein IKX01_02775 [Bacteroidales bacterium]|nr:hypothetical protein [Bacteroidales bacterium]